VVTAPLESFESDPEMNVQLKASAASWKDFESAAAGIAAEVDRTMPN
jgi:hypothetical protein